MVGDIVNGSFGDGLTGWRIVSGAGFRNQPVQAAGIGAQDVLIDGSPLVTLGGDYWHTNAFPLGQDGPALIRVVTAEDGDGVLDSVPFTGDRLSERAHRMIKVASFTAPAGSPLSDDYHATLIATADTLSDPSSGDLSLGADRHTAHLAVIVNSP